VWTNRQVVQQEQQRPNLNLGGLFADKPNIPQQAPAPAPSAVAGAPVISPPNTGDGGLK
jgi:hypothetical protein